MAATTTLTLDEVFQISFKALLACGANELNAAAIASATRAAEADGLSNVGLSHLPDYLNGFLSGKINGQAKPVMKQPAAGSILVEGDGGVTMPAFDLAFPALIDAAKTTGMAALAIHNTFTCGVVGYFVERIAVQGMLGQAYANSPAMMAPWGGSLPFFGTNPIALAVPVKDQSPLIIDQSTSSTAFVNIRQAARENKPLPAGFALDKNGQPTTDANEALEGTIAPAGGYKGANMAMLVDIMAGGLTTANWSHNSASLVGSGEPLNLGQFFIAIDPTHFAGEAFYERMRDYLQVFARQYNGRVPGASRHKHRLKAVEQGVQVSQMTLDMLNSYQ